MQSQVMEGALSGLVATVPMTGTMVFLQHFPERQHKALPPEKVAGGVREILDVEDKMNDREKTAFTWMTHFGFGAAAGALYPVLMRRPHHHAVLKGALFGLGVWTVSYSGWIPAAGILRFPTRESKPYVALQILAHLVWGGALGALSQRLSRSKV